MKLFYGSETFFTSPVFGVIYISSNRITRKYLSKEEFIFIYKTALERLKLQTNDLIF